MFPASLSQTSTTHSYEIGPFAAISWKEKYPLSTKISRNNILGNTTFIAVQSKLFPATEQNIM